MMLLNSLIGYERAIEESVLFLWWHQCSKRQGEVL